MSRSGNGAGPGIGERADRLAAAVVAALLAGGVVAGCSASEPAGSRSTPAGAATDWRNTRYAVTCDGIVPDGLPATVVDGYARVPADGSRPPHYEFYEVRVTGTASGDLDDDGAADTVVLLECSPQPSNGVVQEVQVFASGGNRLGGLPSPRTLRGEGVLPPLYDPAGLSVEDGEIVARMRAYAPEDSRADGPSVPLTVRWRYDGSGFEQVIRS
ncbi:MULTISPECIES: hypothetical protein [unclassified Blastococcus]